MDEVTVRPMSQPEFDTWQEQLAVDYADEQVKAGNWTPDEALARSRECNAVLLPQGLATPGMVMLMGVLADGTPIGRIWISLTHPRGVPHCAFLFDIEVVAEHRGRGRGRALLAAGEAAAREQGAHALELNAFGTNTQAIHLYESSGYRVTTQYMRKSLAD